MKSKVVVVLFAVLLMSCSSVPDENKNKFTNLSYQGGLEIYQARCAVCHGESGQGLKDLYPPIAGSDYLLKNKESIPCIIKNGLEGEITVNGKVYNSRMLSHTDLTDMELADLMTFIYNSWEMNEGTFSKGEIKDMLDNCKE